MSEYETNIIQRNDSCYSAVPVSTQQQEKAPPMPIMKRFPYSWKVLFKISRIIYNAADRSSYNVYASVK